jgi:hypothetical protein
MGMKTEMKKSHPHIVEWFDAASKELKQEIIENCFKKSDCASERGGGKGTWVLDLEQPFFTETKQRCVSVCECVCALWEPIEL